ncbi:MAG TPA: ABC transporter permease [Gaiellaceae bacterium]|nr:ABC transporter permease [Gaiellaceae bacterium]
MSRRSDLALARLWLVANLRLVLRAPRTAFFTFVFPLILLILFDALKQSDVTFGGAKIPFVQFFTPSIAIFGLATATYTGLLFAVTTARDQGVFKRVRGTPLPMRVFLGSWLGSTLLSGVASVVLMLAVGVIAFGVHVYPRMLPAAFVTLVLGGAMLCALALAVSSYIKRPESAPVAANLTLFPLLFISGVFFPMDGEPDWLQKVARLFPLSHLTRAFEACFSPHTQGSGFAGRDLAALAVWGIVGALVAVRRFSIETADGEESGARRLPLARPQLVNTRRSR